MTRRAGATVEVGVAVLAGNLALVCRAVPLAASDAALVARDASDFHVRELDSLAPPVPVELPSEQAKAIGFVSATVGVSVNGRVFALDASGLLPVAYLFAPPGARRARGGRRAFASNRWLLQDTVTRELLMPSTDGSTFSPEAGRAYRIVHFQN